MCAMRRKVNLYYSATESLKNSSGNGNELSIENYKFYNTIGEGAYCKVRVIQDKKNKRYYALKYMPKNQPPNIIKTVVQERRVLGTIRHPFLCNLRYAFQNDKFLFMVIDMVNGGDLRYYLKRYTLSEKSVRRIIGELCCVTDYLHELGIVHRDIKPENIMLDNQGHIHLGDFNVAVELSCDNPVIRGVSGTFNYLAPEMQEGAAYTEQVDWWAVGVVFYECIYGKAPFRTNSRGVMLKLMSRGPEFLDTVPQVSSVCIEAIKKFLCLYPYERPRNCTNVFELEFFLGLSRYNLEDTRLENEHQQLPQFIPIKSCLSELTKVNRSRILSRELIQWKHNRSDNNNGNKKLKPKKKVSFSITKKYQNKLKKCNKFPKRLMVRKNSNSYYSVETKAGYENRFDFDEFNYQYHESFNTSYSYLHNNNKLSNLSPFSSFHEDSLTSIGERHSILLLSSNRASKILGNIFSKSGDRKTAAMINEEMLLPPGIIALGQAGKGSRVPIC